MIKPAYVSMPNSFRAALLAGKTLIGCWASLANSLTTEILGYAGFDWLLLDGEHAPNDLQTFIGQLQALKDSPSAPVVRPPWADPVVIKRLLDIGFFNFLMPCIESAESARAAVAATRYPPLGIRGVGILHRSSRFGYTPDYFSRVNGDICVAVQIESPGGVEHVDAIAAVDGVDALFVGPSDLSAGYGHLGEPNHPDVLRAIDRVVEAGKRRGKAVGILSTVEHDVRRFLAMGMTLVAVGGDAGLLRNASKALCDRFKTCGDEKDR
ncbi:MAG: aldolase/citrate lyase family protein [Polyangiaceae bacterium]|jgi:2-dehydro-3-deoxyglucarate aldolase